jgi:hypothetical protein
VPPPALNPPYEQTAPGGIPLLAVGHDAWSRLRRS